MSTSTSSPPRHHRQRSLSGLLRRKDSSSSSSAISSPTRTKRVPALAPAVELPHVNHIIEINLPNIGWSVGSTEAMTSAFASNCTSPSSRSSISDYSDDSIVTPTNQLHDQSSLEVLEDFQHYPFPSDSFPVPPVMNAKLQKKSSLTDLNNAQRPSLHSITTSSTSTSVSKSPSPSPSTSPLRRPSKHSPSSSLSPIIQKRRPSLAFENNTLNTSKHTLTPSSTPPPRSNHNIGLGLMVTGSGSGSGSGSRSGSRSSPKSGLTLCWGTELGRRRGLVAAGVPSRV